MADDEGEESSVTLRRPRGDKEALGAIYAEFNIYYYMCSEITQSKSFELIKQCGQICNISMT